MKIPRYRVGAARVDTEQALQILVRAVEKQLRGDPSLVPSLDLIRAVEHARHTLTNKVRVH